jgi:ABC-type Na+ efflux pump permease subunit
LTDRPALFKNNGIALATFVGGSFATAYLVRKNMLGAGRRKEAREALVIFGSIGAAFVVVATRTPPDLISSLLSIGIPQFLLVLVVLRLTRFGDFSEHALGGGAWRSNWHAFTVGFAANLLLKALFYCTSLLWT